MLRASLRASAGAISIGWLGRRQHRGRAQALAKGERLNLARSQQRTGNLQQSLAQALLSMNLVIPLYTVAAVMLNLLATGAAAGHWTGRWSAEVSGQSDQGHYYSFVGWHNYIIITCYDSNNGSVITFLYNIIPHYYIFLLMLLHHYSLLLH